MMRKEVSGFVLIVLIVVCGGCHSADSIKAQNNAANNQAASKQSKPMTKIQQGTVGEVGNFSVGVSNLDGSAASLAVWNRKLPQAERNDYLITMTARTGEIVPIGNGFYRVGAIGGNTVEIETEPVKIGGVSFTADTLALPIAGILELHGTSVELTKVSAENGKTFAEIETYDNDYPKQDLAQKGEIVKAKFAAGDFITIGNQKHKIVAVHPAKENARAVVEISIAPVK